MPTPFATIKLRIRAEIADHTFEDVIQYASNFEMNNIPTASIVVPVGKNVKTEAIATIHEAISDMRVQVPARVYLAAFPGDVVDVKTGVEHISFNERLVFEGYAVGVGWRRGQNNAQFIIHLLHWLSDLHHASAISASSHPGNPGDWVYPAGYRATGVAVGTAAAGGRQTQELTWVPMPDKKLVSPGALSDLWTNILQKWMLAVAEDDPIDTRLVGGQDTCKSDVTTVTDAIKRIKAPVPLDVKIGGADDNVVSEGMRQALQHETAASWINTTLWGKIIGDWSPAYWFTIIPRIEDALAVPFTGGLQGDPHAVIGNEDYASCEINGALKQVLRAVGIVHSVNWSTGADANVAAIKNNRSGLAALWPNGGLGLDKMCKGLVLLKDAPKWLMDPLLPFRYTLASQAMSGGTVGNAIDGDGEAGEDRDPPENPDEAQEKNKSILESFAHQWFVIEMLKGRTGEISGKLRWDIAPGSNVRIEAGSALNIAPGSDALAVDLFATVHRVSYVINAEAQKAGTSFSLAHIRTTQENGEEGTSVASPPLYDKEWRGAPLDETVLVEDD